MRKIIRNQIFSNDDVRSVLKCGWGCHHVEISADILCRWFVSLYSGDANPAPSSDLDTKLRAQPV